MTEQTALPETNIILTTPDTCVICGAPSVGAYRVSQIKRYAGRVNKRGKFVWSPRGWGDVHAKLCEAHAAKVRPTWVKTKGSVGPATLRRASYQAKQMDAGQLSYWNREEWIRLHTNRRTHSDKLTRAIAEHCPPAIGLPDLPALPARTQESQRRRDRRADAARRYHEAQRAIHWAASSRKQYGRTRSPYAQPALVCAVGAICLPGKVSDEPLPLCDVCGGVLPVAYRLGMCDDCLDRRLVAGYIARWLVSIVQKRAAKEEDLERAVA